MVKRTLIVLSILSLMLVAAGTSMAFSGCGDCRPAPLFVPVDCCPYPTPTTIVKTWSCKIEGPCPAPGPMCCGTGGSCGTKASFGSCLLANMAGPFEFLFGGCDGVYGCCPGFGNGSDSACGPCWGPIPCILAAVPRALGSLCPNDCMMFGCMW